MKRFKLKNQTTAILILMLIMTSCYEFDFINQPYQADPNSFFDVEICVTKNMGIDTTEAYFGILLPIGWTIADTVEYFNFSTNITGEIIYSIDLAEQMSSIDPPPTSYYWWVGLEDTIIIQHNDSILFDVRIFTDNQTGSFFLDYMLGDPGTDFYYGNNYRGLNYKRSNNHLIIVGDPVGCHPEGITLSSQAEVDSFQFNYPDCNVIAGNLFISGSNITSLSGLDIVNAVGGNFSIIDNDLLLDFAGLNNLTSVGGVFSITGNYSLTDFTGLENITSIGRDLKIENNYVLTSFSSLSGLEILGGDLEIDNNDNLTNLAGLEMISSLNGSLVISRNNSLINLSELENISSIKGNLMIYYNTGLVNLDGLVNITSTIWDLSIQSNYDLLSLSGLDNISSVGGILTITGNSSLPNLSGLNNITAIGQDLEIYGNTILESFTGLENLDTIGRDLWIGRLFPRPGGPVGNPLLNNILALENLSFIGRDIHIMFNDILTNCEAFGICNYLYAPNGVVDIYGNAIGCDSPEEVEEACETLHCLPTGITFTTQEEIDNFQINHPFCMAIEGDVVIEGENIYNLNGLDDIYYLGGNLEIKFNNSLTNLTGLENLNHIEGNLHIYGNEPLGSLTGLEGLTSIGGNLLIGHYWGYGNPALTCLSGLDNLFSIGGYLWILANESLNSLTGLENLNSIDGDLIIGSPSAGGNPSLTTLDALVNLDPLSIENLYVYYNSSLSDCDAQSICDYIDINGLMEIHDNAEGCNNHGQVQLSCMYVSVSDIKIQDEFTISPNPCSGSLNLRFVISEPGLVICDLYEISGVRIKQLLNEEKMAGYYEIKIDLSDLKPGVYFCVLKTNSPAGGQTRKIIKL